MKRNQMRDGEDAVNMFGTFSLSGTPISPWSWVNTWKPPQGSVLFPDSSLQWDLPLPGALGGGGQGAGGKYR